MAGLSVTLGRQLDSAAVERHGACMSNASLFRRHDHAHEQMLLATMPKSGVVEYIDLIPRVPLTGRVWRVGAVTVRTAAEREQRLAVN